MEEILSEDYCSYELSKLLEEKGFDFENQSEGIKKLLSLEYNEVYFTITHALAIKWLREKYNIYIVINPDFSPEMLHIYGYIPNVVKCNDRVWRKAPLSGSRKSTNTYEEAVEAALRYLLTNLI